MDVSIAVSLIRGQMGAVVERAVNGAVETVLAEMLRVVGVKFEELKAQVALMKRDAVALQREKALKEKENDSIRAKLRYTELKLKYYRQGVEEELQQRASASTVVHIHPSSFPQGQPDGSGVSSAETSPSCSSQSRDDVPIAKSNLECTSPQKRPAIRVRDVQLSDPLDLLSPGSLSVSTQAESLDTSTGLFSGKDISLSKDEDREDDCEWSLSVQPHPEGVDTTPLLVQTQTLEPDQQTAASTLSSGGPIQADSSTVPFSTPQIKQEPLEQQEEEQVICIKEEPEEEQEVMASLLLDCQANQSHLAESEAQMSVAEWSAIQANQRNRAQSFNSAGQNHYPIPQPPASLPSVSALPSGMPPRQMVRPWNKDLLYEEYKLRRNELRRRSLNRRRELEKSLPQPLLADLVRERREKTRLRVARWRAKRKLQACLNQVQTQGGAPGLSQSSFPLSSQHQQQQLKTACGSASSSLQRQNSVLPQSNSSLSNTSAVASISAPLPFITPSSSSSLLLRGPNAATHINQHTLRSAAAVASSSSSYPQVSLSHQNTSLMDSDILQ